MAKKKEVIITCNATNVKAVIEGLERGMAALAREEENLLNVIKQRGYAENDEKKRLKDLERAMDAMRTNIQKNRDEQKKLGEVMKDLAGAKLKDLKKALQEGKAALNNMSERDPKRKQLVDDLRKIQNQMARLTGETNKFGATHNTVWQTAVRNITAYMGVFAAFNFVRNKMTEMVRKNYELSDAIMNVRKVSGLAVEDVNQLYQNLTKIDTRNTVNTLMDLAYQGGKLGIGNYGVEGLTGFVKAAEQVQMALGEEMGEEALPAMAKLTENMDLIRKYGVEEAMQKTASAIFQLYTSSVSTGTGIVDFAKRLMPVAKSANVTTDELLGLASATESSGLEAEKASTAFAKMFPAIYKNADAIEKFLNIDQGTIRSMYDQNQAMQAMVMVFDKMQGLGNLNKYPEIFKLLGSEGARMTTVMTAMANNVDMLRTHLKTSTDAFIEGTAVINEYELQNASAAAVLERANNIWEKAFVNPEGVDTVKKLAEEWYDLSKELTESDTWMTSVKNSLYSIASVIGILMKLLPTLIRAFMFYGAAQAIRKLWVEFTALNAAITTASTGMARLSAFMKSNVWVLGATAIAFAVSYICDMAKASKDAANSLDILEEAEKEAKEESIRQRVELKKLYDATQDQTKSIEERKKALRDMVGDARYKEYYEKLANEKTIANLAANAYRDLTDEIIKSARARAYANKITELENKRMALEDEKEEKEQWKKENKDKYEKNKKAYQEQKDFVSEATRSAGGFQEAGIAQRGAAAMKPGIIDEYEGTERSITNIDKTISDIDKDMDKLKDRIDSLSIKPEPESDDGGGGGGNVSDTNKTDNKAKAPEWMVEEKKEAEKSTKAIIGSIEEFYRLQEAAANELAANGQLKGSDFEMLVKHIQDRKDKMLLEARRAIAGDPNEFENERKKLEQDLVKRDDAVSRAAIGRIQQADPAKKGAVLRKYDGSDSVFGLDSNAWLNDVRKNAAQNELNIQRRQAAIQQEVDKILMQYEYVEQAQRTFGDKLVKLGLITDGYDKVVKQLADGTEIVANTKDVQALASKVVKMDTKKFYGVDEDDVLELRNMIDALMNTVDADGNKIRESFASMFPRLDEWMEKPEQYKEQMQAFYKTMIDMDSDYYAALKRNYEQEKREFGERWQAMGWEAQEKQDNTAFETQDSLRKISGQGETFGQTYGFIDEIADDPEIARIKNRMEWRARELEDLQARNASEELIMEKQNEMLKEAAALAEKVSAEVAERMEKIQTLSEPLNEWGEEVGTMLGEMWQGISREGKLTFGQMAKNMGIEYAKLTLKMASENLMKKLQQNLFYKQMEMEEMKHQVEMTNIQISGEMGRISAQTGIGATALGVKSAQDAAEVTQEGGKATIMTMFGISEGASKIIGTLGWWGIPLIGVITALLMGLLSSAKSTAGTESSKATNTPKVKLASGMLTYDEGNVKRFIGQDGKVYTATEEAQPKDGLVTHPIATTVQGQPALVAENGPEIVVGRKTTQAIMMNEPELIKYLANYEKYGGKGYSPFDSGNVEQVAATMPDGSNLGLSSEDARALTSAISVFTQTVTKLQQNGIPAHIKKYGTGGLIEEVKSGMKFMSRYGG